MPLKHLLVQVSCESGRSPSCRGQMTLGQTGRMWGWCLVFRAPRPPRLAAIVAFLCLSCSFFYSSPFRTKGSFFPPLPFKKNISFQERIWLQFQLIPISVNVKDALIFSLLSNCERRTFWSLYESFGYEHKGWGKFSGIENPAHPLKPHHADSRAHLGAFLMWEEHIEEEAEEEMWGTTTVPNALANSGSNYLLALL